MTEGGFEPVTSGFNMLVLNRAIQPYKVISSLQTVNIFVLGGGGGTCQKQLNKF